MTRKLLALLAVVAVIGGVRAFAADADAVPPAPLAPTATDPQQNRNPEFDAAWAEAQRTGMVPFGARPDGTPVGYARLADLSSPAIPVYDRAGGLVAYGVDGYGVVPKAQYEDPQQRVVIDRQARAAIAARDRGVLPAGPGTTVVATASTATDWPSP